MLSEPEQLQTLRRQYFSLYPLHRLQLPKSDVLARNQVFLKEHVLEDPELGRYQPEAGYRKTFWRRVIMALEEGVAILSDQDDEAEVDEIFYELMADLMVSCPTTSTSSPGSSYRTFIYDTPSVNGTEAGTEDQAITLIEEMAAIQAGTTGLRTWTAALHLAHHILYESRLLGRTSTDRGEGDPAPVLELGAGTGFLSILLAKLGADVVTTDLGAEEEDQDVETTTRRTPLARLRQNVNLDDLSRPPRVIELDWTDADKRDRPEIWDRLVDESRTIVAADVIYDPDLVPPLVSTLRVLLRPSTSKAIIAATVRNESTLQLFIDSCRGSALTITTLELEPMNESHPTFWDSALEGKSEVRIFEIQKAVT